MSILSDDLIVAEGGLEALASTTEAVVEMVEGALDARASARGVPALALAGRAHAALLRGAFDPLDEGLWPEDADRVLEAAAGAAGAVGVDLAAHARSSGVVPRDAVPEAPRWARMISSPPPRPGGDEHKRCGGRRSPAGIIPGKVPASATRGGGLPRGARAFSRRSGGTRRRARADAHALLYAAAEHLADASRLTGETKKMTSTRARTRSRSRCAALGPVTWWAEGAGTISSPTRARQRRRWRDASTRFS